MVVEPRRARRLRRTAPEEVGAVLRATRHGCSASTRLSSPPTRPATPDRPRGKARLPASFVFRYASLDHSIGDARWISSFRYCALMFAALTILVDASISSPTNFLNCAGVIGIASAPRLAKRSLISGLAS